MIKTSLNKKLVVVFSSILIVVVIASIVLNYLLSPYFYRSQKIASMQNLYGTVHNQYMLNEDVDGIVETVKAVLSSENLRVFIWDENNALVIDSLPLSKSNDNKAAENNADSENNEINQDNMNPFNRKSSPDNRFFDDRRFNDRFFFGGREEAFIFFMPLDENSIVSETEDFCIFSYSSYDDLNEENLYLRGYLPNEHKILIQMPFASIDQAVKISNTLMSVVGITMLLLGIFVVAITSRTIVKPIKELSNIARSMEKLDFSRKYEDNRKDEIGSLGESINSLSTKLETTINQLYEKNEQLRSDIELKSRIDNMRKEFIANASHELKTPIALISGYAEGLKDNVADDDESRRLYTNVIIEEAEKMDNIIRQMLDLMELDGAEDIIDGKVFPLDALVKEAIETFDLMLKNKNLSVETDFDDDCNVYGDYIRIYRAVSNYISNAVNHVDEKKKISVCVKNLGDKVKFSVYNTGMPIPEEEFENIWERFYKVDKAHTREYGGTGLGLSIVASSIKLHGGQYGVENKKDGVEFYFTLNKEKRDEN